jgi:molybdopterin synthase sulfur carrier subunit
MPRVSFTANLGRHLAVPVREVAGATVRAVLEQVFSQSPGLRSYLLDDQDRLRTHVVIFVNDTRVADRVRLSDPVSPNDEIFVFQALSGGNDV